MLSLAKEDPDVIIVWTSNKSNKFNLSSKRCGAAGSFSVQSSGSSELPVRSSKNGSKWIQAAQHGKPLFGRKFATIFQRRIHFHDVLVFLHSDRLWL